MEAIVFIGIQGSGKSTFFQQRFFQTHVRISMDLLKTRYREQLFLQACILSQQRFVVDNTNVTAAERARYIQPAAEAGFKVVGYFFDSAVREAIGRNKQRTGRAVIPVQGILGTYKKLQPPQREDGFDLLYRVRISP
ncbi:MAG TPA: AAA family ATPase, partial [Thermoanaerobaculia bacterium]|nr:AAA family ATPase [Thermoanaerobaculia bacterium]